MFITLMVIKSFRHKELGELFATGKSASVPLNCERSNVSIG
jgi:hypothetical protein